MNIADCIGTNVCLVRDCNAPSGALESDVDTRRLLWQPDGTEGWLQSIEGYCQQWVTLSLAQAPSVIALGPLDIQDKRGKCDCTYLTQLMIPETTYKGQVLVSRVQRKVQTRRFYRVKQLRAKQGANKVGSPPYGAQHQQGFNPEQAKEKVGQVTWFGNQVKLERRQGSLSRIFIYMGAESESRTET